MLDVSFPFFTFPVHLIVEKMATQIMFVVQHQSLVFVNAATIHHEMMGFVLHFGDYKALRASL